MTHRLGQSMSIESLSDSRLNFREKMKQAWRTKPGKSLTPDMLNIFGMLFHWVTVMLLFSTLMFDIIPTVCAADDKASMRQFLRLIVFVIVCQVNSNWLLSADRKSQFVKATTIPEEERSRLANENYLPLGYRLCPKCQMYTPPRAFHCNVCNACILKRGSHCFITGNCIGLTSQRRFIVLMFYVALGSLVSLLLTAWYLAMCKPFDEEYLSYVPFVALWHAVFGQSLDKVWYLYYVCQLYGCILSFVASSCFLCWEGLMVIRGQTSYEATRSIQTYRDGKLKSLYMVFGSMWWMNFIVPMPTTIPSDGVHWERKSQQKGH